MAKSTKQPKNHTVLSGETENLTPAKLKELQEKFGLTVKIRGHEDVIDKMISKGLDAVSYDRTYPGYGRTYDKDASMDLMKSKILPVEEIKNIKTAKGGGN